MAIEQDPGPEHVEAVTTSHPLGGPDEVVRRFRAGVRDAVAEIGQNWPSPGLEGRQEGAKGGPDLRMRPESRSLYRRSASGREGAS